MLGLLLPGLPALLSPASNPARKLAWTLEALGLPKNGRFCSPDDPDSFFWVGVNTSVPNRFLERAFQAALLPWTAGYTSLRREAANGESRLDGLATGPGLPPLWIECKNVTLVEDDQAAFPDAVTDRGAKHLTTLRRLVSEGGRAAMLYLVQRPDGRCFGPADYIDPVYAEEYHRAREQGVEIYAMTADVTERGIDAGKPLPLTSSIDSGRRAATDFC